MSPSATGTSPSSRPPGARRCTSSSRPAWRAIPSCRRWLEALPEPKRQPNLLFAAYRLIAGTPGGWPEFRERLGERRDEIEAVMLERRTQTNEPARCALMLPLLAALPQPLALLEVGASAGLCLLPDRYGYDYAGYRLGDGRPVLRLRAGGRPAAARPRCRRSPGAPGWTCTRSTSPTPSRCAGWSC